MGKFIKGVQMENYHDSGVANDARGATNIRMFCSDDTELEGKNFDDTR